MSKKLECFSFTGDNHEALVSVLEYLFQTQEPLIQYFRMEQVKTKGSNKNGKALIFTYMRKNATPYPFPVTPVMLAEHIEQYLANISTLTDFGPNEGETGYEENVSYGWTIFKPDWYSEERGIWNYSICDEFAVRPKLIESGK